MGEAASAGKKKRKIGVVKNLIYIRRRGRKKRPRNASREVSLLGRKE